MCIRDRYKPVLSNTFILTSSISSRVPRTVVFNHLQMYLFQISCRYCRLRIPVYNISTYLYLILLRYCPLTFKILLTNLCYRLFNISSALLIVDHVQQPCNAVGLSVVFIYNEFCSSRQSVVLNMCSVVRHIVVLPETGLAHYLSCLKHFSFLEFTKI